MFYGTRTRPFVRRMQARKNFGKSTSVLSPLRRELLENALQKLFAASYQKIGDLHAVAFVTAEPVPFSERETGTEVALSVNKAWAKNIFDCAWVHITGDMPKACNPVFLLDLGGEGLVVDRDGVEKRAVTCFSSDYDYTLGLPVKKEVPTDGLVIDGKIDFWVDAAANDLFGKKNDNFLVRELTVAEKRENVRALAFDLQVLLSAYDFAPDSDYSAEICKFALQTLKNSGEITDETAAELRKKTRVLLETKNPESAFEYGAVGHAHLDLGWLWPIRETYRKGARTFATQLSYMDEFDKKCGEDGQYKDFRYIFGASQAQLYSWMKEKYPRLYSRVQQRAAENRWDVQGATWVEMDSNLVSGESLIRQFRYGKEFFQREFGQNMQILWLPDSFGYSACLPQVMKLAGVPYFLTQKMSWNTVNKFPYHTFKWIGLDGSEVFAHMLPDNTYNGPCNGERAEFGVRNYAERKISDKAVMLFGIGDGGAGPSEEHVEREMRLADLRGLPRITPRKALDTLKLLDNGTDYPVHKGELYLEKHQGTYTTQANNKKNNRRTEFALSNLEQVCAMCVRAGTELPMSKERIEALWQEILLYQFHDILPGSSINRVYEECDVRYAAILDEINLAIQKGLGSLFGKGWYNFTGAAAPVRFLRGGKQYKLIVPPYSFAGEDSAEEITEERRCRAGKDFLENDRVRILFKSGIISSYLLKGAKAESDASSGGDVELVRENGLFGEFRFYPDKGDCWDFKKHYRRISSKPRLVTFQTDCAGATARAVSYFVHGNTVIKQTVALFEGDVSASVDLEIDYKSERECLRMNFMTAIKSERCAFNVQFGHLYRPTTENDSVEKAQFEVSGQKFVDMTGADFGVSVVNDGKYGYRCKGGDIDVTVVRSPRNPATKVDVGSHHVRFSVVPHLSPLGKETYDAAYVLNNPPFAVNGNGSAQDAFATVSDGNVFIEGVSVEDDSVVLHCYNSSEKPVVAAVTLAGQSPEAAVGIAGFELPDGQSGNTAEFRPFELKLLKFTK